MCLVAFFCIGGAHLAITQSELRYGIAVSKNVMLTMRDGVRLATDIYRPTRDGQLIPEKFPAILERTLYNRNRGLLRATSPKAASYLEQ